MQKNAKYTYIKNEIVWCGILLCAAGSRCKGDPKINKFEMGCKPLWGVHTLDDATHTTGVLKRCARISRNMYGHPAHFSNYIIMFVLTHRSFIYFFSLSKQLEAANDLESTQSALSNKEPRNIVTCLNNSVPACSLQKLYRVLIKQLRPVNISQYLSSIFLPCSIRFLVTRIPI